MTSSTISSFVRISVLVSTVLLSIMYQNVIAVKINVELPAISRQWKPLKDLPKDNFDKGEMGEFRSCGWDSMVVPVYDQGPHPDFTPKILDTLKEAQVKTSFFMVGSAIRNNRDLAQRAFNEGHHLGSQGFSFQSLVGLQLSDLKSEIIETEKEIMNIAGLRPRYFRPPFGDINKGIYDVLTTLGYSVVYWNLDTYDWRTTATKESILKVYTDHLIQENLTKSFILGQHDNVAVSVDVAKDALATIKDRGYQPVPLYACLNEDAYQP